MNQSKLLFFCVILFTHFAFGSQGSVKSAFVVRTMDSSFEDFKSTLKKEAVSSYVEWFQLQNEKLIPSTPMLDEALETMADNPMLSYEKMHQTVFQMQKNVLNSTARELIASILIRMSELPVPARLKSEARVRATELFLAHPTLSKAISYQNLIHVDHADLKGNLDLRKNVLKSISIESKIVQRFEQKKKQIQGLEESLLLMNGEAVDINSFAPPQGEHQWALLSNTYENVIFYGRWDEAMTHLLSPTALQPLTEGVCEHSRIISNDFQIQTQARVFSKMSCFEVRQQKNEVLMSAGASKAPVQSDESSIKSYEGWVAAGLLLLVGAGVALKDKKVSLKMPSFHK